jgi:digeranylgeranylglycerophospholipid reductase
MTAETEVLVVGASLAGLCAACSAASGGARTLLVDAAPVVGSRPNPATLLMEPLWRRTGLPLIEQAVEREFSGLKLGGPSGKGPLFRLRAVHLDRRYFDRCFAERAAVAGAEILSGVHVTGTLPAGGVVTDSGPVAARVTIFADGARSMVRKLLPTMHNPQEVAWGLDQLLEAPNLGVSPFFEVRFGSFAPGWRAQFIPLGGDFARLWTFARGVPQEEIERYAGRARRLFAKAGGATVLEERWGVDPAFVVPGRIAGDGVMACGTAAGQGGLEYGARAGSLAGETAAHALRAGDVSRPTLRTYERAWKSETRAELAVLRASMASLRRLSDVELDALFTTLYGLALGEESFGALLRGDLPVVVRTTGGVRSAKVLLWLLQGWIRVLWFQ